MTDGETEENWTRIITHFSARCNMRNIGCAICIEMNGKIPTWRRASRRLSPLALSIRNSLSSFECPSGSVVIRKIKRVERVTPRFAGCCAVSSSLHRPRVSITRARRIRSVGQTDRFTTRCLREFLRSRFASLRFANECVEFLSAAAAGTITEADSWRHARRHPGFFLANLRAAHEQHATNMGGNVWRIYGEYM